MDYSLLVGIHDKDRAEEEQNESVNVDENGMDEEGDSDSPGGAARGANIPTPPDSPVCLNQPLFPVESDIAYDTFGVPAREGVYKTSEPCTLHTYTTLVNVVCISSYLSLTATFEISARRNLCYVKVKCSWHLSKYK